MPAKNVIRRKVKKLAEEAAEVAGVKLFDIELLGQVGKMIVRVTIDREDGIGIKDCETVSRQLEALFDIEDPIQGSYTLEITSPGLDRTLKTIADFKRFTGRMVRIVTSEKINKDTVLVGRIKSVGDSTITVALPDEEVEIPLSIIRKARLEIEI
ncbi:ribosome maturation factor RimP [bacterium BMS3Bbin06]|nr:ribosome maturation factor RimP [bacterium BMS3Abin08]GBE33732.1 ribosome maturation factor RimP [bacterium BMS3Bbin06]HDO36151.1 ribosome maturation factor RimP [Nitrospirota bacterium]HDY70577.1 ribosome maturation factor RimP [Nitrospirota bacterium]